MDDAGPSKRPASLQDVPTELLTRILATACADDPVSAELLFRLGGLCGALRQACGSAYTAPMAATWTRAIIALVDPAGALVAACSATAGGLLAAPACYLAHARACGGWYHLAHKLADRECVACGNVTRLLAWRFAAAGAGAEAGGDDMAFGLHRCCADCTPPAARAGDAAHAEDDASDGSESEGFLRCALVNQQFWLAEPSVVLNAADWEHPAERLAACLRVASEGDTIGLRGVFRSLRYFETPDLNNMCAVRLLGMPDATPWRCVHAAAPGDVPGQRTEQLRAFESESAAVLGFPSAQIHVERNCLETHTLAWFENVYLSSGPRTMGSQLPGEHEHLEQGVTDDEEGGAFCGVCVFHGAASEPPPSVVLRRCWLTGYYGTGFVLKSEGGCAALLECVVTNSRLCDVFVPPGASLRMRRCRVLCSMDQPRQNMAANALSEPLRALVAANDFFQFSPRAAGAAAAPVRALPYRPLYDVTRVRLLT